MFPNRITCSIERTHYIVGCLVLCFLLLLLVVRVENVDRILQACMFGSVNVIENLFRERSPAVMKVVYFCTV